jgi:N-acetylglucosaminyldiphosphoundecaprenol N-acetyl-beta-D-mannosaminyltransferase
MQSENILGYQISTQTLSDSICQIVQWLDNDEKEKIFICANPHSLIEAENDRLFQQAIYEGDLVTPDGTGIVLASKILGGGIRHRITGSDIFWELSRELNKCGGKSYFFLGSTDETLSAIKRKMVDDFPNITFAGCYSPPYKPEFTVEENNIMIQAVNAAQPDVLWVGMTAPKQEKWIHQHRKHLNVKFVGAIGAVFDFYVGNVKRSHPVFQRMGLEWLPRLVQEPRRLFRRNFISSPLFLLWVIKQRLGRN